MSDHEKKGCSDVNCFLQDNAVGTNGGCKCLFAIRKIDWSLYDAITRRINKLKEHAKDAYYSVEAGIMTYEEWIESETKENKTK